MLPLMSAGISFQHGMAIGKFQGVMSPATPMGSRMLIAHLSGSSDGNGVAEQSSPLPGHQVRDVDAFLDVAPGLIEDLAHLRGHGARETLLVLVISAPKAYRISPRRGAGVRRHPSPASRAALMAAAISEASDSACVPMTRRSSAGSRDSKIMPDSRRATRRR